MHDNRWVILVALFAARFCLGFQFQSIGSLSPFLIEDFAIDYSQIGTLVGLYMLPGLILALPGGFIGKRFGDNRVVMAGMVCMMLGGMLSGAADSYSEVIAGRTISGIGAVFLFILMTKMIIDWFTGKELFVAMSLFLIGYPIGIATAQVSQGYLAEIYNWNLIFYLTAIVTVIPFAIMVSTYDSVPEHEQNVVSDSNLAISARELWLVSIAGWIWMFFNAAYLILLSFAPTLLLENGLSITRSGFIVSFMSWVIIVTLPFVGIIADRYKVPNLVMVLGVSGCTVITMLIPFTSAYMILFGLLGLALAMATPVMSTLPAQVLKPENRGPGFGIYFTWFYIGTAFLPIVSGEIGDQSGTASGSILFVAVMLFLCLCLIGLFNLEKKRLWK